MRQGPIGLLRCTTFVLSCSLFATSVAYATDVPLNAATAKQKLEARGVGKMVKVTGPDGKELRARIVSLGETSVVVQADSKPTVEIPYDKVTAVKGPGLSKGVKIAIGVGIGIWIALAILSTRV